MRERFEREREREKEICNDFFVAITSEGEEEKESKPTWVATTLEIYISIMQCELP
jgi:hypothetical protein